MRAFDLFRLSLLATALAGPCSAWAQDVGSGAAGDITGIQTSTGTFDNEIVVTARRRAESLQEIPLSVTALDSEALRDRSIEELSDLSRVSPGLRFGNEGGKIGTSVSLRGLAQTPISNSTPGVVTYFAEVPLPSIGSNVPTVNRRSIGTPYRRAKGTPLVLHRLIDVGRWFRAADASGRATPFCRRPDLRSLPAT